MGSSHLSGIVAIAITDLPYECMTSNHGFAT